MSENGARISKPLIYLNLVIFIMAAAMYSRLSKQQEVLEVCESFCLPLGETVLKSTPVSCECTNTTSFRGEDVGNDVEGSR